MYCVFHNISDHLQRLLLFLPILQTSWNSVRAFSGDLRKLQDTNDQDPEIGVRLKVKSFGKVTNYFDLKLLVNLDIYVEHGTSLLSKKSHPPQQLQYVRPWPLSKVGAKA